MSVIPDQAIDKAAEIPAVDEGDDTMLIRPTKRVLLVWDATNLDMGLGSILGGADGGTPPAFRRPRALAPVPHRRDVGRSTRDQPRARSHGVHQHRSR